ncbi:MAG TPA: acyltransferase [Mycobacteriales bacterium]|nr:acyltransferase [Mycobacteriales bacterium]
MPLPRRLPWDWWDGLVPESAVLDDECHVESSYQFLLDRSEPPYGVRVHRGASVHGLTAFDVGPEGVVTFGAYSVTNGTQFVCDEEISVGCCSMLGWNAVIMDNRRVPTDPLLRRAVLESVAFSRPRRLLGNAETAPVHIGSNVWIGFDAVVMPGVTVGDGAVVGARSVVWADVEPYSVVVGNPARLVRHLSVDERAGVLTPFGRRPYSQALQPLR